nr:hypothetical protein [Dendronalium sp. ChiSLP03b]
MTEVNVTMAGRLRRLKTSSKDEISFPISFLHFNYCWGLGLGTGDWGLGIGDEGLGTGDWGWGTGD